MERDAICSLSGVIVHGKGKGRKVGMPTANLSVTTGTVLPEEGVYITAAEIDGSDRVGVTNVGRRPTVDDERHITIETFFPDVSADLYGREMTLRFYAYLRPTKAFASLEEVKKQVERDANAARAWFQEKDVKKWERN